MARSLQFVAAILGAALTHAAFATAPARNWRAYPAVVQMENVHDVYDIGDLHGDYEKATQLLAGAGLIQAVPPTPGAVQWAGGKAVLVCTGDMIDKGPQSVEVLRMMRALQASARQAGGNVLVTLGNHEAEFLAGGGANKKAAEFESELTAQHLVPAQIAGGEDAEGLGAWLRNLPAAARVDDWFFCHAGNTFGLSVDALEKSIETGVNKDGFGAFVLAEPNSILEARMHPVPWWLSTAGLAQTGEKKGMTGLERLKTNTAALGCRHLVVGHQPGNVEFGNKVERKAGEAFAYEGVLFLMDTGMSRGVMNGTGEVLKITEGEKETAVVVNAGGGERVLWKGQ